MYKKISFFLLFFSSLLFAKDLELHFVGNKDQTQRELYEALGLHKPYFYEVYRSYPKINTKTLELFKFTLQNYYKTKGYFHAKIDLIQEHDKAIFMIEEREALRINSISIDAPDSLQDLVGMDVGSVFASDAFTQSKKNIEYFYTDLGFCNVALDAKARIDIQKNTASLVYRVVPNSVCSFGEIDLYGSENIDAAIVGSLITIEKGDPFSSEAITQSYKSIYRYDGILDTLIETKEHNASASRVDITVKIKENPKPYRFELGLGYSSDEGAMGFVALKNRNFIKDLQTLGLTLRATQIKQSINLAYEKIFLDKNFGGVDLGFEDESFAGFKEQRVLANTYLRQECSLHTFKESLIADDTKVYQSTLHNSSNFILSPKFEYNYDTRDKLLDPTQGYSLSAELMASLQSSISDASYIKYKLSAASLYPIQTHVFGIKTSYGSLKLYDGELPPSYRFFAGGMHSNRAYAYRDLGPKDTQGDPSGSQSIFETTLEWRFELIHPLRAVIFSDTSFLGEGASLDFDRSYVSVGFGLRYKTPIGPIALDLGFDTKDPSKKYALHFHIGELF